MRAQFRSGTDTSVATNLNLTNTANIGLSEAAFQGGGGGAPAGVGAYSGAAAFSHALSGFLNYSATAAVTASPFALPTDGFVAAPRETAVTHGSLFDTGGFDGSSLLGALGTGGDTGTVAGGPTRHYAGNSGGITDASGPGLTTRLTETFSGGTYHFSGNQDIDATLIGSKWSITNLTYSFPTSGANYNSPYYKPDYVSHQVVLNAAQQAASVYAFNLISSYTNLHFSQVTETASVHGNIRMSQTTSTQQGSAEGNFPGSDASDGDIWIGKSASNPQPFYLTPNIGNWGQATFMHEIGHTMGLKHGHQDYTSFDLTTGGYVDGPGPFFGTAALPSSHDGQDWSLMTYRSDPLNGISFQGDQFNQPQTYMQDDIAALQYLYGANFTSNAGASVYTFSASTGEMFINGVSQGDPDGSKILRTIWDGNGIDTYDFSNYSNNETIDLAPGAFSTFSTAQLANHRAYSGGTAMAAGNIANALLYNGDTRSLIENANGGSGNDSMSGNQAANTLNGNAGDDTINGLLGNDTLNGGAGNDTINGGDGADTINASGASGTDTVHGNDGNDTIYSTGAGTYFGDLGNDYMYAGIGVNETLDGGAGTDTIDTSLYTGDYVLNLATGATNFPPESYINFENATTGIGDDTITGSSGANVINGGAGDDNITGGGGADTLNGGDGNDNLNANAFASTSLNGGNGNDYLQGGFNYGNTWDGGAGVDTIDLTLHNFAATYNLVAGTYTTVNGTLNILNFENVVAGAQNDTIIGTTGANVLNGNNGDDTITGGGGADTLNGGDGNDNLNATAFAATSLNGGNGDDYLQGGFQYGNTWDGGAGIDTVDLTLHNLAATYNLTAGTYTTVNGTLNILNFENVVAGSKNDIINGTTGVNNLNGGGGDDTINGNGGGDTIHGGAGNDTLDAGDSLNSFVYGDSGNDYIYAVVGNPETLDGGTGTDTLDTTRWSGNYVVNLATGLTNWSGESFTNFENLTAGAGDDTLTGTAGANAINGGDGNDVINGGGGGDTIHGNNGNDTLNAGSGSNASVYGDAGDDVVYAVLGTPETADGGTGTDLLDTTSFSGDYVVNMTTGLTNFSGESFTNFENLISGIGNDTLTGTSGNNIIHGGAGNDTINAGDGVDSVYGDDGDDVLDGGAGWDTVIDGGSGSDTVDYSWISSGFDSAHIVIDLTVSSYSDDFGTETLVSIENVLGTQSADTIIGTSGVNVLNGNDGNDVINGGGGGDTIHGGNGNDTLDAGDSSGSSVYGDNGDDLIYAVLGTPETLDGGAGTDTLDTTRFTGDYVVNLTTGVTNWSGESFVNFENLTSGSGNDTLTGTTGANVINGGAGNDDIDGNGGNDTIDGGEGDDNIHNTNTGNGHYSGGNGNDTIGGIFAYGVVLDGGAGTDTLDMSFVGSSNPVPITVDLSAGTYSDSIGTFTLTNFENYIGYGGDETITGTSGDNNINGGAGSDTINGGDGNDVIVAGDIMGNDSTIDTVDGGDGDDTITSSGNGAYAGGNGNDLIYAGLTSSGPENLDGGAGVDTLDTTSWSGDYIINLATGSSNYGGESFINFENVTTGAGNDNLTGTDGDNIINGGTGDDTMDGGLGNDSYYVDSAADVVVEATGEGTDTIYSSITYNLAGHFVENLTLIGTADIDGTGNNSNNVLIGNSGINNLDGGTGNDTIDGGAGADKMTGGVGNDTFYVDDIGDNVVEADGAGTDRIFSSVSYTLSGRFVETLTLTGTADINATGNSKDNTLNGNDGDNVINGGGGLDVMAGGKGDDTYTVDNVGDNVVELTGEGTDTINSSVTYSLSGRFVENLNLTGAGANDGTGNSLNNIINGNAAVNTLNGGSGDDTLDGKAGADTMIGGSGNDTFVVDNAGDVVTEAAAQGNDTVRSSLTYTLAANFENLVLLGAAAIDGTGNTVDNSLTGNSAANILKGLDGNDYIDGGAGADTMYGGLGDDTFIVDDAGDNVVELTGEGNDRINSSVTYSLAGRFVETLTLTGAANINATGNGLDNNLNGNDGVNSLDGGTGNDTLDGGLGADTMTGGAGDDTFYVDNVGDNVVEASGAGTDKIFSSVSYTLAGRFVETLTLTGTADIDATGNSQVNTLVGNAGNNTLDGGAGADTMSGGLGNDTYIIDNAADVVTELSGQGTDTIMSSVTWSLVGAFIENLTLTGAGAINATGNNSANILTGNSAVNSLDGGSGNDTLDGGLGADTMTGGSGNDTFYIDNVGDNVVEASGGGTDIIYTSVDYSLVGRFVETLQLTGAGNINATGNSQANTLIGNTGDNTLNGGNGGDVLTGGLGADLFLFTVGSSADTITDFSAGENDMINVNAYTGGVVTLGDLSQVGADTKLDLGGGNVITILNTTYNDPNLLSHIIW